MLVAERAYWRCKECEATFIDRALLPTPTDEADEYRLHQNRPDDPAYRRFLARLSEPLLCRLPPQQSGLDFGCGSAPALAMMLREAGHRVALYDPLFVNDRRVLERRYDFITCSEVAEHLHRPAEVFRQLNRLLKPAGCLAIMTQFLLDDQAFAHWHYRRDVTHVVFYRPRTFVTLAARYHWQVEFPAAHVALLFKPPAVA
jgi:hypothetical protein